MTTMTLESVLTICDQISLVWISPRRILKHIFPARAGEQSARRGFLNMAIEQRFLLHKHFAQHAALLANTLGQRARVDAVHGRDAGFCEPGAQTARGQVMAVILTRVAGDNETSDMNLCALKVSREIAQQVIHGLPRGDAIVAHQGKSDDEELATI